MADGSLTITLDDATIAELEAQAKAAGAAPDDYARQLIQDAIGGDRWSIVRERAAEFDRSGESISVDEAFDELQAMVDDLHAKRS